MVGFFQIKTITFLISLGIATFGFSQNPQVNNTGLRIMFYNVENLFHPTNDPIKNDDEFTKEGTRYWTYKRYFEKINKLGKTAIALGEWEPPAVIGLCEIENIQCMEDIVRTSPLKKFGYKIVFHDCDDKRGIDVALIYRPSHFDFISFESIKLTFPEEGSRPTRDILYTKGLVGDDTLHLFVNHWPSRYGGQLATVPKRNYAAKVLRAKFDSITSVNPNANIVAMGDFNDHPEDESMLKILKAKRSIAEMGNDDLLNMVWQYEFKKGTHKYQHEWGILDQFVASKGILDTNSRIYTKPSLAKIFDADYLMEQEKDGVGKTPNRTYIGFKYHGGYSDHLPIYLDVYFNRGSASLTPR